MSAKNFNFSEYIEDNTIRLDASRRGGGIEIDATDFLGYGGRYELRMTAYQNYLGGGMLGSVQGSIEGKLRDYPTLNHVVGFVRQMRPDLTIVARARDARHAQRLYELGATDAVPGDVTGVLPSSQGIPIRPEGGEVRI